MNIALLVPRWRWIFHTIFENLKTHIKCHTVDIIDGRDITYDLDQYDYIVSPIKHQRTYDTVAYENIRSRFIAFLGGFDCYHRITDWSVFDHVWVLSHGLVQPELEATHYFVQPNGVDTHLFRRTPTFTDGQCTVKQRRYVAGFVGNADNPRKRIRDWFIPICERAGVSYHIHNGQQTYLPRQQLVDVYNQFHVYLNTSVWEGGCNPLLEAAACGLPIISTPTGFALELHPRGVTLCTTRDEMVDALTALRDDLYERMVMGFVNRREIEMSWSWNTRADEWIHQIERL